MMSFAIISVKNAEKIIPQDASKLMLMRALTLCFLGYQAITSLPSAAVAELIGCPHFTSVPLASSIARDDPHSLDRLAAINVAVKSEHNVLFLGDSITERWPPEIWRRSFEPFGIVNAGIEGDRTEHLLWRIDHGNLDGGAPKVVILLIGTNDLSHGRPPEVTAEGIRANLVRLRERLPTAHILLLGVLPRFDRFGQSIAAVNRYLSSCNGGAITYADLSNQLIEHGPNRKISRDRVHLTEQGYLNLSRYLRIAINVLMPLD